MDGKRFDRVIAALAPAGTRRSLVRGVAAGGLATALAALGLSQPAAEARRRRHHHKKQIALTISNNVTGAILGSGCSVANDCLVGLVCAGKQKHRTCQACAGGGACADVAHCCVVGVCVLKGAVNVCV